jgi:inhibitor of cysteine peptidase
MRVRTRTVLALAVAAAALLVAGCVGPVSDDRVRVGEAANQTEVRLRTGQLLEVSLPGNATTGFDWILNGRPPSRLTTVSDTYEPDPASTGAAGAGGVRTFVYRASEEGTGTLRLIYARSFEPDVPPAKLFTLDFIVEPR